jgi:hypothetical protein
VPCLPLQRNDLIPNISIALKEREFCSLDYIRSDLEAYAITPGRALALQGAVVAKRGSCGRAACASCSDEQTAIQTIEIRPGLSQRGSNQNIALLHYVWLISITSCCRVDSSMGPTTTARIMPWRSIK